MRSVRFRLAIWYTLALALGLCLFASVIWISAWITLSRDVQHALDEQIRSASSFLRYELKEPELRLTEEFAEYAQALPDGMYMKVEKNGTAVFNSQPQFPWQADRRWRGARFQISNSNLNVGDANWEFSFAASLWRIDQMLDRLLWLLMALVPAVVLLASSVGVWLSRRALRPVDQI